MEICLMMWSAQEGNGWNQTAGSRCKSSVWMNKTTGHRWAQYEHFNENTGYESTVVSSTHWVKPNPQTEKHQSRTWQQNKAAETDFTNLMECIKNKHFYMSPIEDWCLCAGFKVNYRLMIENSMLQSQQEQRVAARDWRHSQHLESLNWSDRFNSPDVWTEVTLWTRQKYGLGDQRGHWVTTGH